MTSVERVRAALQGDWLTQERAPAPFTFWHPLRQAPPAGDGFVRAVLEMGETYSLDLVKVPRSPLSVEPAKRLRDLARIVRLMTPANVPVVATVEPEDTPDYVRAALEEAGCAGIFLKLPEADAAVTTVEGYALQGLPRDNALLQAAEVGWCNIVHLHGDAPHDRLVEPLVLGAHALSWAGRTFTISLADVSARFARVRCVLGGVDERRIAGRTPDEVKSEAQQALADIADIRDGRGLILAPHCAVPLETPAANLRAIQEAALAGAVARA